MGDGATDPTTGFPRRAPQLAGRGAQVLQDEGRDAVAGSVVVVPLLRRVSGRALPPAATVGAVPAAAAAPEIDAGPEASC